MLTSQIDYNVIADIMRLKESVKQSVEGVMDGSLTAAHLASEVYTLLEQLDKLEVIWRGTPPTGGEASPAPEAQPQPQQPTQEAPPVEQPQAEQTAQEAPAAEQPQPEQPVQEAPAEEQPQPEQLSQEDQQQEDQEEDQENEVEEGTP